MDVLLSDIDGTLVDSNALHAEAWRRAFEHFGIEVGMDEAWRQIGKGGEEGDFPSRLHAENCKFRQIARASAAGEEKRPAHRISHFL